MLFSLENKKGEAPWFICPINLFKVYYSKRTRDLFKAFSYSCECCGGNAAILFIGMAGRIDLFNVLIESKKGPGIQSKAFMSSLAYGAIFGDQVDFLKALEVYRSSTEIPLVYSKKHLDAACEYGSLQVFQYLLVSNPALARNFKDLLLKATRVSSPNHLKMAQYLYSLIQQEGASVLHSIDVYEETLAAFSVCCQLGNLELAQQFNFKPHPNDITFFKIVCGNGHLNVAEYILDYCDHVLDDEYLETCVSLASENNHEKVVHYLLARITSHSQSCYSESMMTAAMNGNIKLAKFFYSKLDTVQGINGRNCINMAVKSGNLESVVFLHELNLENSATKRAIDDAANNGYLDIVKFLIENRDEGCSFDAIDRSCLYNHLDVVKYFTEYTNVECSTKAMNWAATVFSFLFRMDILNF